MIFVGAIKPNRAILTNPPHHYYEVLERSEWCKDQYGLSWQIVPENMDELMERPNTFANMMVMKKIVIADF